MGKTCFRVICYVLLIRLICLLIAKGPLLRFLIVDAAAGGGGGGGGFDDGFVSFHGDYSPPSPPPPSFPPPGASVTCEEELGGIGSLDTVCKLNSTLNFTNDLYIEGLGGLEVLSGVSLSCPVRGCSILINIGGGFSLGENASIVAGSLFVKSVKATFLEGSVVNVSGLAGAPPEQTSGVPNGIQGAGGGHGGRGASCLMDNTKLPEDVWGGDSYAWSSLHEPWSFGSMGGPTSREESHGGEGGGRIRFEVNDTINASGSLLADGGNGGIKGGGGSGGSIFIKAPRMTGSGRISASGGDGFGGGGGGRVSVNVFSRHDNSMVLVHGGRSFGCPENSGGAGTYFDAVPRRLIISNHNLSTDTDTLLFEFPNHPLWTNIYIKNQARACVPLLWSRVQVQGQLSLSCGAVLGFGLAHYASSEFELMAEELIMSDSLIKVYGALRMSVKMHLMWNSKIFIDGDGDAIVATSLLEATNVAVLKESSVIHSNANLGVHGQGLLHLSGTGDVIEAQRLILSLFSSIIVGPGSILRGPLENSSTTDVTPRLYCEDQSCPAELIHPPEDCNVNSSLPFTVQVCRVEDISIEGMLSGSVVHFHWVRTVAVHSSGAISASGLGCIGGVGRGKMIRDGPGGGGGHGGKGGDGFYNDSFIEGGSTYGDAQFPCELGSGSGNESSPSATAGGGIIVMGSMEYPLPSLSIDGLLRADGESSGENTLAQDGPGGGSGGTILLFVLALEIGNSSVISTVGGHGSFRGGGGGGGGRVHFHWADVPIGDAYLPVATGRGSIYARGGVGRGRGRGGKSGTVTGKPCPKGLYGVFCEQCPVGTFKNLTGSDRELCHDCPPDQLPDRAVYTTVRGGVSEAPCPYKCISESYHMPRCYTALEELIYAFGGPWLFSLALLGILVLFAIVLSVARLKYIGVEELPALIPTRRASRMDESFPFLESLNEVLETNRAEESENHVHRMYFIGPNTFSEPWHLSHSPPEQIIEIVYENAFNKFAEEINTLAGYQWWEGSVYRFLSIVAYPLAWSWLQQRRRRKLQQLCEYVRSEYDHACLRSCRSRALYEGLKVAATGDLMLAYADFFLGGDEKRVDLPPSLHKRFPLSLIFGGDGSYMAHFSLHNDNILTSLMSQSVPPTIWYRFVAGINAQLRLVRRGNLRRTLGPVIVWLETHAKPTLNAYGVRVDLARFQPTPRGYCQFGLVVRATENEITAPINEDQNKALPPPVPKARFHTNHKGNSPDHIRGNERLATSQKIYEGRLLNMKNLVNLKERKCYPFSFIIHNTKPVGNQDLVGLMISIILLGDFSLVLLTLLQLYSNSLLEFFLALFILPLGTIFPFPSGINALFSQGPKRSASLSRVYALWNITSVVNTVVAFICGFIHYKSHTKGHVNFDSWDFSMNDSEWWVLPSGLMLCKIIQARLINYHVANLEIQDSSLFSNDPDVFWQL